MQLVGDAEIATGGTIRNIAAVLPIGTVQLPIGSAAPRAGIPWQIARPAPGSNLADRVAMWQGLEAAPDLAAALVWATAPAAGQTALEAGISLAVEEETGMLLAAVPGVPTDSTGRARARVATEAPPAWDLGAVAGVAAEAAVGGADNCRRSREWKSQEHGHEINACKSKSLEPNFGRRCRGVFLSDIVHVVCGARIPCKYSPNGLETRSCSRRRKDL